MAVSELDDDYISLVICDRAALVRLVNTITTRENICAHTMCACVIVVESKLVYVSPANDLSTLYSSSYLLSFALSCISFWRRFVCVCSTLAAFPPPLSLSTALSSHLLRRHILLSFLVFGRLSFMDLMRVCR